LGDSLGGLKEGRPVNVVYDTTFLINWPEHLGSGFVNLDLVGSMLLVPTLAMN
jgi:hypothetical protein